MKVALITVATNKYEIYVRPLLESAAEWFFASEFEDEVSTFVFTNRTAELAEVATKVIECPAWGFPEATLYRYRLIADHAAEFDGHDVIVWVDADSLFVGPVGREIVPGPGHNGLFAVRHPGFFEGGGSWETNPSSRAFVPANLRRIYWAGGLNGGLRSEFLAMAAELADAIDDDASRGITAVWHDESFLQEYLTRHPPKTLSPAYVYPSHLDLGQGIEKRVLALFKDHAAMRS